MYDNTRSCQGLYSALDCLSLSDLIVESVLLFVSVLCIGLVLVRLKRMAQPANYTQQQERELSQCNFIHYILLVYLVIFALCTVVACMIYLVLDNHWFGTEDDQNQAIDSLVVQILIKTFWMLLYGYITILNIMFFVIAYSFLAKAKVLRHERRSRFTFWGCFVMIILQIVSYGSYVFLIFGYREEPQPESVYLTALRFINLSWSVVCTVVLLYIFFISYRKKVFSSAYVSQRVKKTENKNILVLTMLHLLRIGVEVFNITSGGLICKLRELNSDYIDQKHWYSIYLSVANLLMNVVPVIFILGVFKPPRKEFLRPSLVDSETSGSLDWRVN